MSWEPGATHEAAAGRHAWGTEELSIFCATIAVGSVSEPTVVLASGAAAGDSIELRRLSSSMSWVPGATPEAAAGRHMSWELGAIPEAADGRHALGTEELSIFCAMIVAGSAPAPTAELVSGAAAGDTIEMWRLSSSMRLQPGTTPKADAGRHASGTEELSIFHATIAAGFASEYLVSPREMTGQRLSEVLVSALHDP